MGDDTLFYMTLSANLPIFPYDVWRYYLPKKSIQTINKHIIQV